MEDGVEVMKDEVRSMKYEEIWREVGMRGSGVN